MSTFFTSIKTFFLGLLPSGDSVLTAALSVGRIVMAALAVLILVRCIRSLLGGKVEQENWGFLSLVNGARYELSHWENVIGRAKSCDVRVNFASVSRSHAVLSRDDKGLWHIFPLNPRSGVLLNGEHIYEVTEVKEADVIAVGGVEMHFFPASADAEQKQAQRRTKPGAVIRPAVTLLYLTLFQILMCVQLLPAEPIMPISFVVVCGVMWGLYFLFRALHRTAYEAETLVFLLITTCFGVTSAYDPGSLRTELAAMVLGILLYIGGSILLRDLSLAVKLRWPVSAAAAALLAFNVVFGARIFGAKNWVSIGPISFQPSEFVKLAFILAGAATLDRLFARRNLVFTVLFSAFCVGCLALMSDFGTALVFFVAFLCIAFLRSGDLPFVVMVIAAAGFGGGIILRFKPYIADRFSVWRHVWEYAQDGGYQQTRTMSAAASGGLFGVGPSNGWLKEIGAANTDLVFGVVCEEFGLILALCAVIALVALAIFVVRSAATARSCFYTIASCSAVAIFLCQAILNVFGAVDLLPLTGVTFPFLSMGGSSMMACWGLLAFVKAADTRQNASFTLRLPKKQVVKKVTPTAPPADLPSTFFDEMPDIPVDDIFGKEDKP
jgi:cell division protein FtsW